MKEAGTGLQNSSWRRNNKLTLLNASCQPRVRHWSKMLPLPNGSLELQYRNPSSYRASPPLFQIFFITSPHHYPGATMPSLIPVQILAIPFFYNLLEVLFSKFSHAAHLFFSPLLGLHNIAFRCFLRSRNPQTSENVIHLCPVYNSSAPTSMLCL